MTNGLFTTLLCAGSVLAAMLLGSCSTSPEFDVVLRGGAIYDGSGGSPFVADLAIAGDRIAAIGALGKAKGKIEIDAAGLAVAPGFINMMSWANESLIEDGRAQSDIRQGVTLEVLGEGHSMGPLSEPMKKEMRERQGDIRYPIEWTTLGEYLEHLERRGVSPNVASFIGAATPRIHVIGYEDRPPSADELNRMQALVRQAMEEGAVGVASSLVYPPGFFASTEELIALCRAAASYGGLYASHLRSEGSALVEAADELIRIAREAGVRAEIYHLKAAGKPNWPKLDEVIARVEKARAEGLEITADVYTYAAGSTGLNASMPPWVQEGGFAASIERMKDPATRERIAREMKEWSTEWENMYLQAGSPEGILLVSFKNEALKLLTGKTLGEVARMRGKSPEETAMDLIVEDGSRIGTVYFSQSEDNLRKNIRLPWVSFCSDSAALAPEGVFLKSNVHPRAYGSFARVLGKFTRDEKLVPLEEAVRKLSALPAETLRIDRRGRLRAGFFADVVVFDPAKVQDHATYAEPHRYATGVVHVFVNGVQVLQGGEHTGAKPGRFVRGPGWKRGEPAPPRRGQRRRSQRALALGVPKAPVESGTLTAVYVLLRFGHANHRDARPRRRGFNS
jgi:N-acyl-D-amino-acid deacylase